MANGEANIESLYTHTIAFYFRLIASTTGFVGLFLWAIHWYSTPTVMNVCMQIASCWIFWRGFLGEFCKKEILLGDTLVLLALIFSTQNLEPTLTGMLVNGPFSVQVYIAVIAIFLTIELADIVKKEHLQAEPSKENDSSKVQLFVALLVLGLFLTFIALPFLIDFLSPPKIVSHTVEDISLVDQILLSATKIFSLLWVFILGTCIGSFLNVLIYRMPIGKSVLFENSHCLQCQSHIGLTDNLPILGWLKLRGKCRNCQLPISIRYPVVEAITGFMILILFSWEALSGGWNIPIRPQNLYRGFVWIVFYTKWDLIGLFIFHAFLFCTLFTWLMIERDKKSVPAFSFWSALLIVFASTLVWPMVIERWEYLLPILMYSQSSDFIQSIPLELRSLLSSIVGGATGACICLLISRMRNPLQLNLSNWHSGIFLVLIGSTIGWQSVVIVSTIWIITILALNVLNRALIDQSWKINAVLLLTAFSHQLFWKEVYENITSKIFP